MPRDYKRVLNAQARAAAAGRDASFTELVDALRRDLATRYLREPKIAIAEVAFLLGFSESSAFHRAFKRWQGTTPAAYRANLSASE